MVKITPIPLSRKWLESTPDYLRMIEESSVNFSIRYTITNWDISSTHKYLLQDVEDDQDTLPYCRFWLEQVTEEWTTTTITIIHPILRHDPFIVRKDQCKEIKDFRQYQLPVKRKPLLMLQLKRGMTLAQEACRRLRKQITFLRVLQPSQRQLLSELRLLVHLRKRKLLQVVKLHPKLVRAHLREEAVLVAEKDK